MKLGMVGLGKMGSNMVRRLMRDGHRCAVFDLDRKNVEKLEAEGAQGADSIEGLVRALEPPRVVWMMVPAGEATGKTASALMEHMEPGDVIIDGGNSFYKDDVRRAAAAREKGIRYVDAGTSGGVWGIDRGYCLMIGGESEVVRYLDPIFRTLAPGRGGVDRTPGREHKGGTAEEGYYHCGPSGSGHFVKMVHNGIEYGVMQAYAEGLDILANAGGTTRPGDLRYDLDLADVAEVWRRGSVIGSWLLDLTAAALLRDASLEGFSGFVQDSGEGRWTVDAAVEEAVPANVIAASLFARFRSRQNPTFADKVLSAMRFQFGGHEEPEQGQ